MALQTSNPNMALGVSPDSKHPHNLQWQQEPWISAQVLPETGPQTQTWLWQQLRSICRPVTAERSSYLFGPSNSTALRYQESHRWRPRSWVSVCPLVATQGVDIRTDSGYNRSMDSEAVLGNNPDLNVIVALVDIANCLVAWPQRQHEPKMPTRPQVAAQTLGIFSAFYGHGDQHRPSLW